MVRFIGFRGSMLNQLIALLRVNDEGNDVSLVALASRIAAIIAQRTDIKISPRIDVGIEESRKFEACWVCLFFVGGNAESTVPIFWIRSASKKTAFITNARI